MAAYTPIPIKLDGVLVKEEGTYGTDPTPTVGDNGVRIAERLWGSITVSNAFPNARENAASGDLGPPTPALPNGAIASLTIPVNMKGAGAAYAADSWPEADPLLQSCGLAATVDYTGSAEWVKYTPASTSHISSTIWAYAGNKLYKVVGCRGTVRWALVAGELTPFIFEMQGYITDTDSEIVEVALPAITYSSVLPPSAMGASMTLGAWTPQWQSAEATPNTTVQRQDSGNAASGVREFAISQFDPTVSLVAETDAKATWNPHTLVDARTAINVDWTIGATQYNRCKLDVNSAWLKDHPTEENFNDFTAWGLELGCAQGNFVIHFD